MEFFISQVQVVLPVVGFDFLRPKVKLPSMGTMPPANVVEQKTLDLVLTAGKHGYEARAIEVDGEIIVLAGSRATTKDDYSSNGYSVLREQLMNEGRLVPTSDPEFLEFAEDVSFASPTAAAAVIRNRNANGRTSWRLVGTGQTLKEWQDAQLEPEVEEHHPRGFQ
ncbi:DUF4357 domain-containing protein [Aurantimonas sp. A2-1-M11]|uniref:DUF4357 domain-containing protein n=1 Tax=Aurantimonas sp. A2-1-M11 TaxID=3113712 RepID=UPI002F939DAC